MNQRYDKSLKRTADEGTQARRRWEQGIFAAAAVIVVAGVLLKVGVALAPYVAQPTRNLFHDVDWAYLNTGLESTHGLSETARWWTQTWCGAVPFWRPLTSYALWAMYLLWPPEYMLPREIVLVALHLCFTALAVLLLWRLTRSKWLVLTALCLFAVWRPYTPGSPQAYVLPVHDLLTDPKNLPDTLVGLAMIGSLLLVQRGRWLAALGLAAVSVGFKETGFTTWLLAAIMLTWMRREKLASKGGLTYAREALRVNSLRIVAWVLVLVGLVFIHFMSVGYGYRQGSNDFWIWRVAVYVGRPMLSNLLLFDRTGAYMALFTFLALLLTWRSGLISKTISVLCAVALGIAIDSILQGNSWAVSATRILGQGASIQTALICLVWLTVVWLARAEWLSIIFWLLMALTAAAPTWMAAQTWAHGRYVASVFMAMAIASVLIQDAKVVMAHISGKRSADGDKRT